jgi:hypothetical protein
MVLRSAVCQTVWVKQTTDNVMWEEDNEENASSSGENVGINWFAE